MGCFWPHPCGNPGEQNPVNVPQICVAESLCRIRWDVLNWNENAIRFYERMGATNRTKMEGWLYYQLEGEAIEALATNA